MSFFDSCENMALLRNKYVAIVYKQKKSNYLEW